MEPSPLAAAAVPASTLPWMLGSALVFLALCAEAWRSALKRGALEPWSRRALLGSFVALLALSLAVRLGLATAIVGVPTDIACFKAWAMAAAEGGLSRFYAGPMFVDYPPGYIYVLKVVGQARLLLGLAHDSRGFLLLVKLPAILLDVAAALVVLWLARNKMSLARACVLSLLVAWNPAAIHNSAVYGQVDVFLAVPLVLALAFVQRGAWLRASTIYVIAVLLKPQALLLAPLAVLALLRRRDAKTAALAVLAALVTLAALTLPFSRDPTWLVKLYSSTLGSYPYATLNAANLHALVGGNWAPLGAKLLFASHGAIGAVGIVAVVAFSAWLYLRSRDGSSVFVVALVVMSAIFFLSTKMHERYLYPAVLIAAAAYAVTGDRRLLALFAGFSVSVFLNEALLHDLVARTGSFFVAADDPLLRLLSVLNAALVACSVKVAYDLGARERSAAATSAASEDPSRPGRPAGPAPLAGQAPARLSRLDYLLMGGLSLAYAAGAFTNLGSLSAPQNCWKPSRAGETSYLDLGQARHVGRIVYFLGIGEGAYSLETSADGQSWTGRGRLEQPPFGKLEWRTLEPGRDTTARYLRVSVDAPGVSLCEIAAFEGPGRSALPLLAAAPGGLRTDPGASLLVDEPGSATYEPSFFTGMYFDEIFHARTAYEHLHRLEPSETTHPPLGKAIIALGVAAFGMTPFGWRFMGAVFGVAMIPMLYLFAHRLFRRTDLAFLAGFLLACDFMHFVQTRIATIDTYGVFFVILMYFFMHQYLTRDFWRGRTRDLLVPLLLSGIAFGLGAASKWSVLYGGAGLAVILFASLLARGREYLVARRLLSSLAGAPDADQARLVERLFPRRALAVLGWCLVCFVVVPGCLYLLAYVPLMLVPGAGHGIRDVVASQAHMYRYHSGIAQTHPFSSAWWQWPLMQKPAWYYMGDGLPAGTVSSIVAMGNPAVWWPGIAAVGAGLWLAIRRREASIAFILVALFAQFAPWAIAPRKLVFIYHFFPCVPFLILALVYAAKLLVERYRVCGRLVSVYCAVVLGLFALYYPILSAMPVKREFVLHWLRWFDSWILC
ncbi:MAG TPA: glycosyltransferase family 39 protein [Anaeromyxobacteraceae bacterium]|nr:glycosyltransferase family 39 protein [Anaeromyxobacteraceae bacterium]